MTHKIIQILVNPLSRNIVGIMTFFFRQDSNYLGEMFSKVFMLLLVSNFRSKFNFFFVIIYLLFSRFWYNKFKCIIKM